MPNNLDITILCTVVDNFGDIGVCWRLCKHLLKNPDVKLRLVTDDLTAFNRINSKIDISKHKQDCQGVTVYYEKDYDLCYKEFTENPPVIILECFQCGYADWLEKILFEDRVDHTVNIIMIDYLSAEEWADDFHGLKSLTRTALVPKVNYMPGFSEKTGGLLFPEEQLFENAMNNMKNHQFKNVLFFAYEKDWDSIVKAMNKFFSKDTTVKIAGGVGQKSILQAVKNNDCAFTTQELSYINQEDWDSMMSSMDFMIIRGEDSMAQACLLGIPFIWQAYVQEKDYQLVKVNALLERMKPFFNENFQYVKNAWQIINNEYGNLENAVTDFLEHYEDLKPGFEAFARSLRKNGDLANNLMTFIENRIKMDSDKL